MVNRKSLVSIFLLFFLCGVFLSACKEDTPKTEMNMKPAEVDVIKLTTQTVKLEVELPGRTAAYRIAEVRPQVGGILQQRVFSEGSEVEAGQILYQIDQTSYQAKLDIANAELARAKALEYSARLKAEKYTALVRTNAVSELDQIEIEANWKQAVAEVAAAEAEVNSAQISFDYTKVKAPISGRVGRSMISEGALVTAQQSSPLAIIQQLDPLYVDVIQSSTELLRLKKGLSTDAGDKSNSVKSTVRIVLEDGSEYDREGTLEFSDVTVEQSTGTVILRAMVSNPEQSLLPGMFVRARLGGRVKDDAILVPAAAISRNSKGQAMVMLVNADSKVESRIIESGQKVADKILVKTGLIPGELLITAGFQNVRPGGLVKAVVQQEYMPEQVTPNTKKAGTSLQAE